MKTLPLVTQGARKRKMVLHPGTGRFWAPFRAWQGYRLTLVYTRGWWLTWRNTTAVGNCWHSPTFDPLADIPF